MFRSWDIIYSDRSALFETNCGQIHMFWPKKGSLPQFKSELPFSFENTKYFNTHEVSEVQTSLIVRFFFKGGGVGGLF